MLSYVKNLILIITVFLFYSSQSLASDTITDPIKLYGDEIYFDVFREGDKVGYHSVKFFKEDGSITVKIKFSLEIDFLFLTAYRFKYLSEAKWVEGQLDYLKASVDDDGKESEINVNRQNQLIYVEGTNETFQTSAPIFPTNHWNNGVLNQTRVLNTLTGLLNKVLIVAQGSETIPTENGLIKAKHYTYRGDLNNEVWYDNEGRWVKMRFKASDGSIIEYVCKLCQGKGTASLSQ
jgi:hypothetical protein